MSTATGAHIVAYPYPAPGHIIPFLDLTIQLLNRGLSITIFITQNNLHLLDPLLSRYTSPSQLRHFLLPPQPIPTQKQRRMPNIRAVHDLHHPILLGWLKSQTDVVAIISDFFLGWTRHLACQLNIPRLVFCPSGAFAYSIYASMWKEDVQWFDDLDAVVTYPKVPKSPSYPWWQVSQAYRLPKDDLDRVSFKENALANLESWGFVINSFSELEGVYLEHIKNEYEYSGGMWAVGPLLPADGETRIGGISSIPVHEILRWLDGKKDDSVVYLCFGSRGGLTHRQINDVLAQGLEKSEVHFVWCVGNIDAYGSLLDSLIDRVNSSGKGLVIKGWAPQVEILRHRAVGTFVTHCGWNSVLEGLAAGVVMLTWPMGADQFTDAELIVDHLGVGFRLGEGTQNIPEPNELARVLANAALMEGLPERLRAKKLKEAALHAIKEGSSQKNLDAMVTKLNEVGKSYA